MATQDWINGLPTQTDNTNIEWSGGLPYVIINGVEPLHTLSDNFNDNSIDAKWTAILLAGGTVTEANSQIEFLTSPTTTYSILGSSDVYDLTSSYGFVKVVDAGNQSLASLNVLFVVQDTNEGGAAWVISCGTISANTASDTYVANTHRYLRIREASGVIYWDYSADCLSWTNFDSETVANLATDIKAMNALLVVGCNEEASTTTVKFDDFNIIPGSSSESPSLSPSTSNSPSPSPSSSQSPSQSPSSSNSPSLSPSSSNSPSLSPSSSQSPSISPSSSASPSLSPSSSRSSSNSPSISPSLSPSSSRSPSLSPSSSNSPSLSPSSSISPSLSPSSSQSSSNSPSLSPSSSASPSLSPSSSESSSESPSESSSDSPSKSPSESPSESPSLSPSSSISPSISPSLSPSSSISPSMSPSESPSAPDEPTTEYIAAIKASQREFVYYLRIYFEGESNQPICFDNTQIESMVLLEEAYADSSTPLGAVSSNELTVYLNNINKEFSPKNTDSPYYGKLVPNLKVEAMIGIKLLTGIYEYIELGTFYTSDWDAPTNSVIANVICYDSLFNEFNKPMPQIPIQENLTMDDMFEILFRTMGFTTGQFNIDFISFGLKIGWLEEQGSIRDGLQDLAQRSLATVFVQRDGTITVLRNNNTAVPTFTWADTDMIIDADMPHKYQNIFSQVNVGYHLPFASIPETVLTIETLTIPTGGLSINNLLFNSTVGAVETVRLIGAVNSVITSMTIGAKSISLVISNTGVDEDVAIEVTGRSILTVDAKYSEIDLTAQSLIGNIMFDYDSIHIQTKNDAIEYAQKILPLLTDPSAYITLNSRGDPSMKLTDGLLVNDTVDIIENLNVIPIRANYDMSSGLSCTLFAIKKDVRDLM